jgi:phosphatidylglycerophosphatase C
LGKLHPGEERSEATKKQPASELMDKRTVVLFDLDGTITRRDTYLTFLLSLLHRRKYRLRYCFGLPFSVLAFQFGLVSNSELKRRFFRAIAGGSKRGEIADQVAAFLDYKIPRLVKPTAMDRIEFHRALGHQLVLVTAGIDVYVDAIGRRLGFHEVICTRAAWNEDRLTGDLDGPNMRGKEKLLAVERWLAREFPLRPRLVAYTDHHSDVPLLGLADDAVAVDPTRKLAAWAVQRGLRIERWL